MKNIVLIVLLVFSINLTAQPAGRQMMGNKITGIVIESSSNKPLEFANIVLYKADDSTQVTGTVTNKEGFFELQRVRPGSYYLTISFIGFDDITLDDIQITRGNSVDLGTLKLELTAYGTNDVVVEGERSPISYEIDRKVINVSEQYTASSGSAVEVLENVPSVTVDIEGNVSLRGSSNFTVLIDGRPTILDANDALQQTPASAIENIEIITNPSAKYNPEGTAGIINIVMKKNKNLGVSSVLELDGGLNDKYGAQGLFDIKNDNLEFTFGLDYNDRIFEMDNFERSITTFQGTTTTINSIGLSNRGRNSFGLRGSFTWLIDEQNSITLGGRYGNGDSKSNSNSTTTEANNLGSAIKYSNLTRRNRENNGYNFYSTYKLEISKGHELTAEAYYSKRDGDERNVTEAVDANNIVTEGFITTEGGPGENIRLKTDYVLPLNQDNKIEAGVQSEINNSTDLIGFFEYNTATTNYDFKQQFSNDTRYRRNIHSIYSMYRGQFGALGYQAGLRAELTDRKIELLTNPQQFSLQRWDYFPTLHLSYKFDNDNQIMGSYARRIDRPRGWYLEPFQTWTDQNNIRVGNPSLKPEYIDSYDLGFQTLWNEVVISLEGYYRVNHNKIERLRSVFSETVTLNTIENVGTDYSLGTEMMFNFDIIDGWNVNLLGNVYNYRIEGKINNRDFSRESFNWTSRLNNIIKLAENTSLQINGMYNSPTVSSQGRREGFFMLNLAVRQTFFEKALTATLQVRNVLDSARWESISEGTNFYSYRDASMEAPIIMLNLKYNFNNFKQERNRNGGDNDGGGMGVEDDF